MRRQVELSNDVAAELAGPGDAVIKTLEDRLGCDVFLRGNVLTLEGDDVDVELAENVVDEVADLVRQGLEIAPGTIEAISGALEQHESPRGILEDVVWSHRGLRVAPKTLNQKRYLDAIRHNTITVGIGPAGTGKSFLAVAMAVAALSRREVNRIILTRPAVEAGERLGFLPGDLMAKVDPYLRPLFDALYAMLEPERVNQHLERGVIEIAPLAFMRGRAQPLDAQVLTPDGFRDIGSLRVGDLVIGSNGRPTPVLGVYPQGRKEVFRVTTQDGASTLACGEHLWSVMTLDDHKPGRGPRIIETREMIGNLRRHHQRRYELPLLRRPACFPSHDVPLEPYGLGLLLGDGCLTGSTTPTFSTNDPDLAEHAAAALPGIVARHKRGPDYVLSREGTKRGGVAVAHPLARALDDLGLLGTRSESKFVPALYLHNDSDVRLGVLQGLLDSDGRPVTQSGRSCRIQYTTCSPRLRDDVLFLVRSLGGVAYYRTRVAEGRKPGRAHGRPVEHRHDAYVMDIRLPAWIEPFQLERKRSAYEQAGGGRPMRMIESIEPAGETETVCIQVAAEDSLYVTDDFLVTHNTLSDAFIILDEAQNTTPEQMQMFLTRLGFNSKMVVTGDITQVDLERNQRSGLLVISEILEGVEDIEFVRLKQEDVVRHKLVQRIVQAYDEHSSRQAPELRRRASR